MYFPPNIIQLDDKMDIHISDFIDALYLFELTICFSEGKVAKNILMDAFKKSALAIGLLPKYGFFHEDLGERNILYDINTRKILIINNKAVRKAQNTDREFSYLLQLKELLSIYICTNYFNSIY
ncbi:hypothetical protein FACS1894113_3720 [Alphaproteobacteria bacterium]|nr:hypothetical protein FACS1894113_3720 [Alphaproteobacteria bacterium]